MRTLRRSPKSNPFFVIKVWKIRSIFLILLHALPRFDLSVLYRLKLSNTKKNRTLISRSKTKLINWVGSLVVYVFFSYQGKKNRMQFASREWIYEFLNIILPLLCADFLHKNVEETLQCRTVCKNPTTSCTSSGALSIAFSVCKNSDKRYSNKHGYFERNWGK